MQGALQHSTGIIGPSRSRAHSSLIQPVGQLLPDVRLLSLQTHGAYTGIQAARTGASRAVSTSGAKGRTWYTATKQLRCTPTAGSTGQRKARGNCCSNLQHLQGSSRAVSKRNEVNHQQLRCPPTAGSSIGTGRLRDTTDASNHKKCTASSDGSSLLGCLK